MKSPIYLLLIQVVMVTYMIAETPHADLPGDISHPAFRTVQRRENDELQRMLKDGLSPNLKSEDGTTLLMYAALHGDAEGVRIFLQWGADSNASNDDGVTALIWGASDAEKVRLLIKHHADVNAKTHLGATPLTMAAASTEGFDSVKILLGAGADASVLFGQSSALWVASLIGNERSVEALLDHYQKVGFADPSLKSAFEYAIQAGHAGVAFQLLDYVGPGALSLNQSDLNAALDHAIRSQLKALQEKLLDMGAEPRHVLHAAYSEIERPDLVARLISNGSNPHETEYHHYTALDYALFRGHHKVEKLLREQGVHSASESEFREIPHRGIRLTSENQDTLVSDAVIRGVDIVLQSAEVFLRSRNGTNCASCHHGSLASMAGSLARDRGMNVNQSTMDRIFQREYARRLTKLNGLYQRLATFFPAPSATFVGYLLWGWSMQGIEPDGVTKVLVWQILETQQEDGRWEDWSLRPPMTGGDQMATALVIRALKSYPLAGRGIEIQDRLTRARVWLEDNPASTLTLKAFRLLGMAWAGTIESALSKAADELILMQKEDGGWAQLQGMESDAWATGLTLIALHHAGMTVSHAVYQRGMEYLLNTQFDDGSWFIRSRSNPVQPHHDSHFPFGWDQWISHAGTSMACASLALALKPVKIQKKQPDKIEPAYPSNEYFEPNPKAVQSIDFKEDIFPILQNSCSDCHTGQHPKGSFSMRDRPSFLRGGISSLPTAIPGNNHQGQLLRHVTDQIEDLEMPPLGKRNKYPALTPEEVKKLEVWITEGAFWPEDMVLE